MRELAPAQHVHQFCWADLATLDDARAAAFYVELFGWAERRRFVAGGRFSTLETQDAALASLYQLARQEIELGVPAHWIPYVSTPYLEATLVKAQQLGGKVIIPPHEFARLARISVITDPTGALIGLWQGISPRG